VTALDPAVRELLAAIQEVLEADPHDRAPFDVAAACSALLIHDEHGTTDPAWAAKFLRAQQRRRAEAGATKQPADPPLLTRPHDWPPTPERQ